MSLLQASGFTSIAHVFGPKNSYILAPPEGILCESLLQLQLHRTEKASSLWIPIIVGFNNCAWLISEGFWSRVLQKCEVFCLGLQMFYRWYFVTNFTLKTSVMMPIKTFSHFCQVIFFFKWLQFEKEMGSWGKEETDKHLCLNDKKIEK